MGFEQLAALKAQLTKEAKLKKQQEQTAEKPAPAEKQGRKHGPKQGAKPSTKPAGKTDRPARPGGQPRPSEKTPPVDPVVRVIGKLQKRFPAAFPKNPAPKVPLKVGILADLIAQASDMQLTEAEIREAVSTWCRGSRYWACLTDGAARVDLSGAPAGTVTARDAAFARNQAKGGPGGRRKPQGKTNADQANAKQANADQVDAAHGNGRAAHVAGENGAEAAGAEAAGVEAGAEAAGADAAGGEAAGAEVPPQPQHGEAQSDASSD